MSWTPLLLQPASLVADGVDQIENAKTKIIEGCQASPTCLSANPDGVPTRGWTSCTTTNCNPCEAGPLDGGAGVSAPSLILGIFALVFSFLSQV